jgi:hypothetical protein
MQQTLVHQLMLVFDYTDNALLYGYSDRYLVHLLSIGFDHGFVTELIKDLVESGLQRISLGVQLPHGPPGSGLFNFYLGLFEVPSFALLVHILFLLNELKDAV